MRYLPKVGIYYDTKFGRNDGPPLYYTNAMKKHLGLEVHHSSPTGNTLDINGPLDIHYWVDWGEDGLPIDHTWFPPQDGGKAIYICSDAHFSPEAMNYRFSWASKFDYVGFNQKWYIEKYHEFLGLKEGEAWPHGQEVYYIPHAAEPLAYPHFEIIKKWDVCFIGHIQEFHRGNGVNVTRIEALDRMFAEFPNFYFGTRNQIPGMNMFEDAAKKFCQSKIVFNISIGNDLNMRFFEVLSAGGFLLTNDIPELQSVPDLVEGIHYVSYKTMDEAVEKAKYYLAHDAERETIALMGHTAFLDRHTYAHRIVQMLKAVGYDVDPNRLPEEVSNVPDKGKFVDFIPTQEEVKEEVKVEETEKVVEPKKKGGKKGKK